MEELLGLLQYIRSTLISVSTGGQNIEDVNTKYSEMYWTLDSELESLGIENPINYSDLWQWYGKWSSGDLPRYADRRQYVLDLLQPIEKEIKSKFSLEELGVEITAWQRVNRTVSEIRKRLASAENEEQYQALGLLCRDAIISVAQEIHDPEIHVSEDGVVPSDTDSKRMIDSYISHNVSGQENETLRRYAKSINSLANELTHKRTATLKLAKLCCSSSINLINLLKILEDED